MSNDNRSLSRRISDIQRDLKLALSRMGGFPAGAAASSGRGTAPKSGSGKDLIISPSQRELNHNTGVLLNRIFSPSKILNIRSHGDGEEQGDVPARMVDAKGRSRAEVFCNVMDALSGSSIRRILCVPYSTEDYLIGIACKSILGVPMAVWVVEDSFAHSSSVATELAAELFELADIRFAISPEMRDIYEHNLQKKFHILPPTVEKHLLSRTTPPDFSSNLQSKTCCMLGNIPGGSLGRDFLGMVSKSGWTVHWFGNAVACKGLQTTVAELSANGIIEMGSVPDGDLPKRLAGYPFAILPTGSGDDEHKDKPLLSLPSQLPFLYAGVRMPALVVGDSNSCPARFVRRFDFGLSSPHDEAEFTACLGKMADPAFNSRCRANCAGNANSFSDEDLATWIWDSCAKQVPADERFESIFRRGPGDMIGYVEDAVPKNLYGDFKLVYSTMRRISRLGYKPDFVIDVGGSSGVWSDSVHRVFPSARFVLIEPLPDRYSQWYHKQHPEFEWVAAAASNKDGEATFQISNDLYGSSLFTPEDNRSYQSVKVPVVCLDSVMAEKRLTGRGIVKIDVQYAEHLVVEGAEKLLDRVDFLIMELTLRRCIPEARTFLEMVNQMEAAGFLYYDDIGDWRCPITGVLEQKDVIFVNSAVAERYEGRSAP